MMKMKGLFSEVGLGLWQYRGGVGPIHKALDLGATHLDTAQSYGTEAVVGRAVQGRREDAFVATKVGRKSLRHDDVLKAAEGSLERLGIDCIDLYQVHAPNPDIPIVDTIAAMEKLVDRGMIRHFGVSNFSVAELQAAMNACVNHSIFSNQVKYSLSHLEPEEGMIPFCEKNGIMVIAHTPLAKGSVLTSERVIGVAQDVNKTPAQVVLNYCLSSSPNVVVIPKSNSASRIEENCGASGWSLSEEQRSFLKG